MSTLGLILVAAGDGQRFRARLSSDQPQSKTLIRWDGHALFIHSLRKLQALQPQQTVIVFRKDDESFFKEELAIGGFSLNEDFILVPGGRRRQDSVRLGLEALGDWDRVAIHDAARPFVSIELLEGMKDIMMDHEALVPVLPVAETLKEVNSQGQIARTVDRSRFFRAQTPQFFHLEKIRELHRQWTVEEAEFTDDSMLFEKAGYPVQAVEGEPENIKVTVPEDLKSAGVSWT